MLCYKLQYILQSSIYIYTARRKRDRYHYRFNLGLEDNHEKYHKLNKV